MYALGYVGEHGVTVLPAVAAVAVAAWPVRALSPWVRGAVLGVMVLVILCAPIMVRARGVDLTIVCLILGVKLVDLHVGAGHWRGYGFGDWLRYLVNPFVLTYRRYVRERPAAAAVNRRLLARGLLEMAAGAGVLVWAYRAELGRHSFWLDHIVKLAAAYLLAFDGLFVFVTGAMRSPGIHVMEQSRHPILARTPADFWRRYNREAGTFLYEDVFKSLGGLHAPLRGIVVVFLVNGLAHEYLFGVMSGQVTGYQLAFFSLHGAAVAATFRLRPAGTAAVVWIAATQAFLVLTAVLFFASVHRVFPWYTDGSML